jgi:hypothetical protein
VDSESAELDPERHRSCRRARHVRGVLRGGPFGDGLGKSSGVGGTIADHDIDRNVGT